MPLVQLSRLRSQLNALEAHFNNPKLFLDSVTSLFLVYENKPTATNRWLRKNSQISIYNVPQSVMSELESRLEMLARLNCEAALINADNLWKISYFEPKKAAIALISNLTKAFDQEFLQRIKNWLSPELEESLIKALTGTVETRNDLLQDKRWLDFIKGWLDSRDLQDIKLGLLLLKRTLRHGYQNLPLVFSILSSLINNPPLAIQKDLVKVIQELIDISEAETASFIIMSGKLFPNAENVKFLRKCIPLFGTFFQKEIRHALSAT